MMFLIRDRTMGQIDISAAVVTAANQTYTGSALTPTPTVTLDGETIPSTGYDVEYSNNTNAGTAIILITGKGDYTGIVYGSFTIAKANPVYVAPTAQSLTYSRSAQWLTTTGSTSHGDIVFSSDGNVWTSQRISGTNAGSYTTYWKLIGDSNHNSVSSTSITTIINKATPVVATPPSLVSGLIYSGSAQNLLSGGSFKHSSADSTAVAGTFVYEQGTNAGTYEDPDFTFTPTDTTNYNTVSAYRVGTVTIGKANASVTKAPTAKTGQTYNGNAKALVNAGTASGGTMYYYATTTNSKPSSTTSFTTTIPTKTNAGTYYVWYYVKGDSNHNDTSISSTAVSVTIAKANRTISFTTAPTSVEIGATITVVAAPSAGSGDGTITYSSSNTGKATVSGNVVTGVAEGTVSITATISAGTNYNSATTSYSLGVTEIIYENHYLTFVAAETGTFTFTNHGSGNNIQYSINGGSTWVSLASATASPSVSAGSKIMWKSTRTPGNANNNYGVGTFSSTGRFDVEGNAMSLLFGDDFVGKVSLSGKAGALGTLFEGCTTIVDASNMKLPATTTITSGYLRMFRNCVSLVSSPNLPATKLVGAQCYYEMFRGCTSLTVAPDLPATTLTSYCYYQMFMSCSSLVQAQEELPATTLQTQCYYNMYDGCSALLVAPKLPATTLAYACYGGMFRNCTSLTAAPDLHALTLTTNCYNSMFTGCTNLNYIKCLATDISASNCTLSWMYQTKSGGTFVKNVEMDGWPRNNNGIPSSWTVEDAS